MRSTRAILAVLVLLAGGARLGVPVAEAELVSFSPTSAFPNRYARNICSLSASSGDDTASACQVESAYGAVDGRLGMAFGERNCTVTLKNCVPGVCYSFRDATAGATRDQIPRPAGGPSASFFVSVAAGAGASASAHTNDGFSFRASASEVTLTYETRSCLDHFSYRGRTGEQECRDKVWGITEIGAGMPTSLAC